MAKITRTRKPSKPAAKSTPASPAPKGRGRRVAPAEVEAPEVEMETENDTSDEGDGDEVLDSAEELADRMDRAASASDDDADEGDDSDDDASDDGDDGDDVATMDRDDSDRGSSRSTSTDPRDRDRRPDSRYPDRGNDRDQGRDNRDQGRDNRYPDRSQRYSNDRAGGGSGGGGGGGYDRTQDRGPQDRQQQDFRRDNRPNDRGYGQQQRPQGGSGGGGGGGGVGGGYGQQRPQGSGDYRDQRPDYRNDPSNRPDIRNDNRPQVPSADGGPAPQRDPSAEVPYEAPQPLPPVPPQPELLPFNPALPAGPKLLVRELQIMDVVKLQEMAKLENIPDVSRMKKQELIVALLRIAAKKNSPIFADGILEVFPEGFGFIRSVEYNFLPSPDDFYVSPSAVRKLGLRTGHVIKGMLRPPRSDERFFSLCKLDTINGEKPDKMLDITNFEDMTPIHPTKRLVLETDPKELNMRIVDLVTPIGMGQRMLIVAPPRTGKTVLMQKIANAISKNHPEAILIILLIDERPEEVTDMKRHTSAMVCSSTFDEITSRHVAVTEMVSEMAKRYVEFGKDVVILMDSITRMARAYNIEVPSSGKILSGGVDANALQRPKRFFGAARALEEHGSLTILGTALIDTGSKMDEVIFEEFKGTGNAELHLDRRLVEKRVYPSIDINGSGTRREELLLDKKELELVYRMRRVLADMNPVEAIEMLKGRLGKVSTNAEFLMTMSLE